MTSLMLRASDPDVVEVRGSDVRVGDYLGGWLGRVVRIEPMPAESRREWMPNALIAHCDTGKAVTIDGDGWELIVRAGEVSA